VTASSLGGILGLDAGYISRLLSALGRRKLIRHGISEADGREKLLTLTAMGEKAVVRLNEESTKQIQGLLGDVNAADREALVRSLSTVRSILDAKQQRSLRIVRLTVANEDALVILQEYYDAVHVIQRDKPGSVQKIVDEPGSGVWLAYLDDEVVGCVVLRRLRSIPSASECKRLYVKSAARGNGIADRLLDAQENYARSQGVDWIYLDSFDDLKTAIGIYQRRGYEPCARYNDNPQATLFMRKRLRITGEGA
jgi:GNAT superfamily N-acetyltransferase